MVEAKSAGDFTNTNKRRKEEAKKISQLRRRTGRTSVTLFSFADTSIADILGYEAADGIDWVWEHRIEDFDQLGI